MEDSEKLALQKNLQYVATFSCTTSLRACHGLAISGSLGPKATWYRWGLEIYWENSHPVSDGLSIEDMGCSCQQSHLKSASIKITNRLTNQVMQRSLLFSFFMERTHGPQLSIVKSTTGWAEKLRQPARDRLQLWVLFWALQSHLLSEVLSYTRKRLATTRRNHAQKRGRKQPFFLFSFFLLWNLFAIVQTSIGEGCGIPEFCRLPDVESAIRTAIVSSHGCIARTTKLFQQLSCGDGSKNRMDSHVSLNRLWTKKHLILENQHLDPKIPKKNTKRHNNPVGTREDGK